VEFGSSLCLSDFDVGQSEDLGLQFSGYISHPENA